jgi:superfamily II DNA or RNA helicase
MLMTGTLETNDNTFIYGVEYDEIPGGWRVNRDRSADIFIPYDRKTALKEGAIVPIEFYHHDGPVKFSNKGGEVVGTLSRMCKREERAGALFTALRTEMATQLLERGVEHWKTHGDQLIVVAANQAAARVYHSSLAKMGVDAVLAISEETEEAKDGIKKFRRGMVRALVTCAMCYEGMDAKRATHLICLTHIRSVPWIEQMLARIWRAREGKGRCWAFVPDDAEMNDVIEHIRSQEISDVLGRETGTGGGEGGGPSCVVPISSGHETTKIRYLDEEMIEQESREQVIAAMQGLGFSANDPVVDVVMRAMSEKSRIKHDCSGDLTESEEAKALRNGMADLCRRADAARSVPYGTTQKELYVRTRIIFPKANLEELRRAAPTYAGYCEAFLAR